MTMPTTTAVAPRRRGLSRPALVRPACYKHWGDDWGPELGYASSKSEALRMVRAAGYRLDGGQWSQTDELVIVDGEDVIRDVIVVAVRL